VPISAAACQGTPFTVTLTINPLPVFNVLDAVVCAGEYVTLTGNPSSYSYSWDHGITNNAPFVPTYTDTYNVVATNTITGCVQYSSALVTVHPNPIADFIQTWDELMAIFTNTSSGALNYYWNMGDGGIIITSKNVSYTYEIEDSTSYIITLIAETEFGCIDTISRIITTPLVFYIPNAFTPDGNEYNNVFTPIFSNKRKIENYSLSIYNRWGEIVFETKDVDFGWDGFYKNKMAESGTYIWQLQFTNLFNSKKEQINGHINLLR
jgi:gliding motility-associated-like protein